MKKIIRFDKKGLKEIQALPTEVQEAMRGFLNVLARDGKLKEPVGKKITQNIFEIRIKFQGQWRVLYLYHKKEYIIVLSAFQKKTQKTPKKEIQKAYLRSRAY